MVFPKQPGTYCFHNTVNNKVYVGSAKCLFTRINKHLKGQDSNKHLQNAIKHYGINTFCITYQVLETKEEALCLEQMLLDYIFKLNINCYNISSNAYGGDGSSSKIRYAMETNNPEIVHTFSSSCEAEASTGVPSGNIHYSCKNAKPGNGLGRWLFSDVSEEDLIRKFNNLTPADIKGSNKRPFILINKITGVQSQIFYGVYEPQKLGYKVNPGNLSPCLLGTRRTVNGYYVSICI